MEVSQGSTSDLAIQARELLRMRTAMEETLAEHTGRDLDQIRRDLDRETILDGSQAVAYGLVDLLLPVRELRRAA